MKSKDFLFVILSFLQAFVFLAYSLPLPIYPELALSKNVTKDIIGVIFACYPITHLLTSFLFGKVMGYWDRKNMVLYCLLSLAFATLFFGVVDLIENTYLFILCSIFCRLLQGCGVAGYDVVCFAIFPKLYPDTLQEKLGYFAVACGIGISIGPILGGVLYSLFNYEFVFFSVSFVYLLIWVYLKKNLDFSDIVYEENEEEASKDIGYMNFFKNFQFILTIFSQIFAIISVVMLYPILGDRIFLLGGNTMSISLAFAVNTLCYSGIVMLSNWCNLTKRMNRKLSISIGFFLCILSLYLIAYTEELNTVIIGMGIMGFGHFFVLLPIIPELISIGSEFPSNSPEKNDIVNDLSAALFNAAFGFTEFAGPVIGGFLDVNFGFSKGIYFYIFFIICFWIVYLILGGGLKSLKTPCVEMTEREEEAIRNSGLLMIFRSTPSSRSSVIRRSRENSLHNSLHNSPMNLKKKGGALDNYFQELQKKLVP